MNKCHWCGKFRSWDDLAHHYAPDDAFSSEELWFECKGDCPPKKAAE